MLAPSGDLKVTLKRKMKRRQSQSIENKIESPVGIQRRDALIDYAEGAQLIKKVLEWLICEHKFKSVEYYYKLVM